ncbi:transposase [Enterobacter hormaechei]
MALWSSSDALVLKMLTGVLETQLPVHPQCEHVRGNGGGRQSILRTDRHLREQGAAFVFRTDIQGYYATIDKSRLYDQLCRHVSHPVLLNLLWQFLHYSVEQGGNFHTPRRGISRGAALSPLLAAFHLYAVDSHFEKQQPRVRYVRYMDDFLILAPGRWILRRAVRDLKRLMAEYGFTLHPDKTQLGYTARGFDWMGVWFTQAGMQAIAPRARNKHLQQCRRLYEQIRSLTPQRQVERMAQYRRRWVRALVPPGRRVAYGHLLCVRNAAGRSAYTLVQSPFVLLTSPPWRSWVGEGTIKNIGIPPCPLRSQAPLISRQIARTQVPHVPAPVNYGSV